MDAVGIPTDVMATSLERVAGVTQRLGGLGAIRKAVRAAVRTEPGCSVLDVGTGNLALPLALREDLGGALGFAVGLDSHEDVIHVAARSAGSPETAAVVRADARNLPFADGSFDLVVSTLTLHHLDEPDAVCMLREMGRVARLRVLVWDLERSLHGLFGAALLARTLWRRDPLVRYDAPLSVRRAYRRAEVLEMAVAAGLKTVAAKRSGPGHLLLTATPREAPGRSSSVPR